MAKICTWNDQTFGSVAEAARANTMPRSTLSHRLIIGRNRDEDMLYNKPVSWNGIAYDNIRAAANANFITYQQMAWRLRQGYTCDDDMKW